MSHSGELKRRWGTDQRLEFIEFRLFWEGGLNRSDIMDRFGVSMPQASSDLALYKELAPENLEYDSSGKRFVATGLFEPRVMRPNADRYLLQLKAISDGVIAVDDTNIGALPANAAMPVPHRRVDPLILRKLVGAIRGGRGLDVYYHSMNAKRPQALWRTITPHAFSFDSLRWHVRAYCHLEARFKDFILSRFLEIGKEQTSGAAPSDDIQWQTHFDVIMEPNPALSESQRQTISRDYDMEDSRLVIPIRRALLYYFNKRLRLDVADHDSPKEAPITVANRSEFEEALLQAISER